MHLIILPGENETSPSSRFMAINARDIWLSVQQLLPFLFFYFFPSLENDQDAAG